MSGFLIVRHPQLQLSGQVPNDPAVRESYEARGWEVVEEALDPDLTDEQIRALRAEREVDRDAAEKRSEAARKAAETRRRNAERGDDGGEQDQRDTSEAGQSADEQKE